MYILVCVVDQGWTVEHKARVYFQWSRIDSGPTCKDWTIVEFVLAPQHETSCDSEITTKEDFDYWKKIIEESNLEVYRRIHDKPNEAEN